MKLIIDTHIWIWAANSDTKLAEKHRLLLSDLSKNEIGLVDISIWEAGRIHRQGKLTSGDPALWFAKARSYVNLISITPELALIEQSLDWQHKDPADRLIVSAALLYSVPVLTKDKIIKQFKGVKVLR